MKSFVFDFDNWSLDEFVIGEKATAGHINDTENGYEVYVRDKIVTGIFVCLRDGYRGCKKFRGLFLKNSKYIDSFGSSKPDDIEIIFGGPVRSWDDGSEISMEFQEDKYQYEFVWRINEDDIELNYMLVEING